MRLTIRCAAVAVALVLAGPATAQTAAPDAATLKIAREVVAKAGTNRDATLASLSGPMTNMVQQMGVSDPAQAQLLVKDVVMPVLASHFDGLLDVQAQSYASVLSAADLRAVLAFYDTPAGRNLVAAQPKLAQAQLTGMSQWMTGVMPDLQTKLAAALKARADTKPKP